MPTQNAWEKFLASLATDGGNIVVLLIIIVMLAVFEVLKFPDARQQLYFVIGALVGVLRGKLIGKEDKEKEDDKSLQ